VLKAMTVGFLGGGNLTEAMVGGILRKGAVLPGRIIVTNRQNGERLQDLRMRYGVRVTPLKADVIRAADIVVVACKPKDVGALLDEVGDLFRPGQILLTAAAGVQTSLFLGRLPEGVEVVRCMPNTSALIGLSATAMARGEGATDLTVERCRAILGTVGTVVEVAEGQMDAVTGLSGSGPAYIYYLVEVMMQAGAAVGLDPQLARTLVLQTIKGAAQMLESTGADPALLREQVTSPGGTTQAGLTVLRERGFPEALVACVARATERAGEMGAQLAAPERQR
jgi:pyrroline-5-carboxylate reductase